MSSWEAVHHRLVPRPPRGGGQGDHGRDTRRLIAVYSGKWPANDLTGLALIGRIGEEGAPFLVGKEAEITAAQDGELQFMVNDDILNENDGILHVRVTVSGPGGR